MKSTSLLFALAISVLSTACHEELELCSIPPDATVYLEFIDMEDQSVISNPQAFRLRIDDANEKEKISTLMLNNMEELASYFAASTLPFGYLYVYHEDLERLVIFKLNSQLANSLITHFKKSGSQLQIPILKNLVSYNSKMMPTSKPYAMVYKLSKVEFSIASDDLQETTK